MDPSAKSGHLKSIHQPVTSDSLDPVLPDRMEGKHQHGLNVGSHVDIAAPSYKPVPLLYIFIYTTLMALASGLGAVPFFIFGRLQQYWAGIANAVAVGVMLSASFDLLHEGAPYSPTLTIAGFLIGGLFIKASQDYLSKVGSRLFFPLVLHLVSKRL